MAKQVLPTNFKDDVLASSMNGKRRYILTENGDGTFSLEDATTYTQEGDVLGAARLNAICKAINESVDQAKVIESVDDLKALTEAGFVVGGKAGAQIISNLSFPDSVGFYPDVQNGVRGYNTDPKRGADTFIPFKDISICTLKFADNSTSPLLLPSHPTNDAYIEILNGGAFSIGDKRLLIKKSCTLNLLGSINAYDTTSHLQVFVNGVLASEATGYYVEKYIDVQEGDYIEIKAYANRAYWFYGGLAFVFI